MKKRLSERTDFANSLILSADYMSNPGMNGECELGVRWLKDKTEIWQWCDGVASEAFSTLPKNATARQIIAATINDDRYPSSVNLRRISVTGDRPPLGDFLCLLWADDESHRRALSLMTKFNDSALASIAELHQEGLLCDDAIGAFLGAWNFLDESGIDAEEVSPDLSTSDFSASGILNAFKNDCLKIERRAEDARIAREAALKPYAAEIQNVCAAWNVTRPPTPPRTGRYPPPNPPNILKYLEMYALREGSLPTGVHNIPGGRGYMGRQDPGATVDFDELRGIPSKNRPLIE